MSVLFISHSSSDHGPSSQVKAWLQAQGHASVFLDFDPVVGIPPGADWEQSLYRKLRECQGVVVVCSQQSMASRWVFAEVVRALSDGKPVFPIRVDDTPLDPILERCQTLDARQGLEGVLERLDHGLREAGIEPAGRRVWKGECPYPGLMAFDAEHAPLFFGRDEEIHSGLGALRRLRRFRRAGGWLALVRGASGSGKSSLLRAGLLPRLQEAPAEWLLVGPLRPGEDPFAELAGALSRAGGGDWREIRRRLTTPGTEPASTVLEIARELRLSAGQSEATVLLLVDQFEELLDVPADHPAHRFLAMLVEALGARSGVASLATLRSDYLSAFLQNPTLEPLAPEPGKDPDGILVGPLPHERLVEVIERPAGMVGRRLEPALVQALVDDTGTSDALPLLAFTLRELWEQHKRQTDQDSLRLQDYREGLGGLQESVGRAAEGVLEARRHGLGAEAFAREETALRRALLSLVRINEDGAYARRPTAWDQLPQAAHPLLKKLVEARLLIARGEGTVEVAHEALFRTWLRLRDWLDEEREALRLRRRLEQQVEEWSRYDRAAGYLVRDPELSLMAELLSEYSLAPLEREFLDRSQAARDEERARAGRLRRWLTFAGVTVLLVILGVVTGAWWQVSKRNRQLTDTLRQATGYRLAVQAESSAEKKPELALLLAAAAEEVTVVDARALPGAENVLQRLLALGEPLLDVMDGTALALAFSPDGRILSFCSSDGAVRLVDTAQEEAPQVLKIPGCEQGLREAATLSRDGKVLAFLAEDGSVRLWDVGKGGKPRILPGGAELVTSLAFSWDGGTLACGSWDGSVRLWDVDKGSEPRVVRRGPGAVRALAFSSNGAVLASGAEEGSVQLWDLKKGSEARVLRAGAGAVRALAFSSEGRTLATSTQEGPVRLWDVEKGQEFRTLGVQEGAVRLLLFSPKGRTLAAAGNDETVRIWDVETAGEPRILGHQEGLILTLAFAPNGRSLASGSGEGMVRIWDQSGPAELVRLARTKAARDFTPEEIRQFDLGTWGGLLPPGSVGSRAVAAWLARPSGPEVPSLTVAAAPEISPLPSAPVAHYDRAVPAGLTALGLNSRGFEEFRNQRDGSVLIRVPGGPFTMGSDEADGDEKPPHEVDLEEFLLARYEVTNEQFKRFVAATGYDAGSQWRDLALKWGAQAPVVCVSWNDAQAYCRWAGLRLPTEAEWEKAARGTEGRLHPWGNEGPEGRAWFDENGGQRAHDVGSAPAGASPYGCLDMAGNAWEPCQDWYDRYPGNTEESRDFGATYRVLRGGSWLNDRTFLRSSNRGRTTPDRRYNSVGFRVALSVATGQRMK